MGGIGVSILRVRNNEFPDVESLNNNAPMSSILIGLGQAQYRLLLRFRLPSHAGRHRSSVTITDREATNVNEFYA